MAEEMHITPDEPKPFLAHLEDLRRTIFYILLSLLGGMAVAIPFAPKIFSALQMPLKKTVGDTSYILRSLEITGGFSLAMQIVFWSGLILSIPFIALFIIRFILPALTVREFKAIMMATIFAGLLFIFGVIMGYVMALPAALKAMLFLHSWLGVKPEWVITSYVSFAMNLLLAFGLAFELPVVLFVLGYLGLVSSKSLSYYRRHSIVVILIAAMILTPGPDVISQLAMAIPMYVLYELCIIAIRLVEKKGGEETL